MRLCFKGTSSLFGLLTTESSTCMVTGRHHEALISISVLRDDRSFTLSCSRLPRSGFVAFEASQPKCFACSSQISPCRDETRFLVRGLACRVWLYCPFASLWHRDEAFELDMLFAKMVRPATTTNVNALHGPGGYEPTQGRSTKAQETSRHA